jgi:DNA-binding LacI/PurR family transcriptional regulator
MGVILPLHAGVPLTGFVSRVLHGVLSAASEAGLTVIAGDTGQAERIAERQPDAGLILLARPAEQTWRKLAIIPRPLVWAGAEELEEPGARTVLDYEGAGRECGYKLVGLGHRRIGLLRPDRDPASSAFERGVRHALGSAGLAIDPSSIQVVDRDAGETGLNAADALLGNDVTGVIVAGAPLLTSLSEASWRRRRPVPSSVSVVALLDESGPAWMGGVAVEACVLDPAEVGRRAVRQLREWSSDSRACVECVAWQWQQGQSLAAPGGPPSH